jgi:arylsulfatase A-like enzyme
MGRSGAVMKRRARCATQVAGSAVLGGALLAAFSALAGCALPGSPRPDIVLIVIDTLRADHLPFYGYQRDTASFLSELATRSVVFENAYATSSWTAPSTASIFTSLQPVQHRVLTGLRATEKLREDDPTLDFDRIPEAVDTLPEVLRAAGYRTFGVTDNLNIDREQGFDRGFEWFVNFHYETGERVNRQLEEWQDDIEAADPYFLYVHYMDPHRPYRLRTSLPPPPDEDETRILAYDSEIAYVDRRIRELFDRFEWKEDTVLIVTADHGEGLGSHGVIGHGVNLYQEALRVPLLIHHPAELRPARIRQNVSLIDILPTIRALAGLPPDPRDEGVDLLSVLRGEHTLEERPVFGHVLTRYKTAAPDDDRTVRAAVVGSWKYLSTKPGGEELYDLARDPGESTDLSQQSPDLVERLRRELEHFEGTSRRLEADPRSLPLDAALQEHLEALGYVEEPSPPEAPGDADDPSPRQVPGGGPEPR